MDFFFFIDCQRLIFREIYVFQAVAVFQLHAPDAAAVLFKLRDLVFHEPEEHALLCL